MSDPTPPPLPVTNATSTTEIYVAQPKGRNNPVVIATSITAALTQIIGLLVVLGFDISDDAQKAVLGCVEPLVVALVALGPLVQNFTTPAWKAKALIDAAHQAGMVGGEKPQL